MKSIYRHWCYTGDSHSLYRGPTGKQVDTVKNCFTNRENVCSDFLTGVWIRLRGGPLLSHQYMAEKHKQITAHIILGKTKVERVNILVTHNLAWPLLPSVGLCNALLDQPFQPSFKSLLDWHSSPVPQSDILVKPNFFHLALKLRAVRALCP